jgi:hypothetical protein
MRRLALRSLVTHEIGALRLGDQEAFFSCRLAGAADAPAIWLLRSGFSGGLGPICADAFIGMNSSRS